MSLAIYAIAAATLVGGSTVNPDDCSVLPRPTMRLRLTTAPGTPTIDTALLTRVAEHVWQPHGLTLSWVEAATALSWDDVDLWVSVQADLPVRRDGGHLGEIRFEGDMPGRVIRLSVAAATQWLVSAETQRFGVSPAFESMRLQVGATRALLPRALGYVLAHELGHFVLATRHHARSGLMRDTYLRPLDVTTGRQLHLDANNTTRLRERLARRSTCR